MAKKTKGETPDATVAPKRPRAQRLPGTDDAQIAEIEQAAEDYVEVRDERQELTRKEVAAKEILHAAMRKYHKTHYSRGGIEVDIITAEETVKVRIRKGEDD